MRLSIGLGVAFDQWGNVIEHNRQLGDRRFVDNYWSR